MALGILFAFLSAASFGMNSAGIRRGMSQGAASQGLYITIFTGLAGFLLLALATRQLFQAGTVTSTEYGFMFAGGIVHILIGRYFNYRAIGAMGANRASPVTGTATLASVFIAVAFLNETITPLMGVGIGLVMIGPALVARRSRRPASAPAPTPSPSGGRTDAEPAHRPFQPRLLEGYFFGVMAALFWGLGPVLMRAGVSENGLGVLGGLVSYAAAALVLAATLLLPGQFSGARALSGNTRWWFLLGGTSSFLANAFRYSALALAPVSVAIPLMRLSALFALGFNFLINRHLESFEPRVIVGILVSLAGAV
ncbi:MAG: EamA family transporter, partial [Dehalococcoidia bacterium]